MVFTILALAAGSVTNYFSGDILGSIIVAAFTALGILSLEHTTAFKDSRFFKFLIWPL